MNLVWVQALSSVFIVSIISLVGVFTLGFQKTYLNNLFSWFISFSAGALLGDVFIHLLPEVAEKIGFGINTSLLVLFGIISTFVIEKIIHWQHHRGEDLRGKPHPVTFITIFGDGIHNFIDGLIIGGSYLINPGVGIATTFAIILHEIPQEIGNFAVLIHGGYTVKKALFYNFLSALTAVFGTILALTVSRTGEGFAVYLSAYTAGTFIYIAGSDLIPELHKEVAIKKSINQFIALILGIAIMLALLILG